MILSACNKEEVEQRGEPMEPEELSTNFLNGDYEKVYGQTSKEFQKEVSLEQFRELGEDFNQDVSTYELQSELPYGEEATQYVWTDDSGSKGMIAVFDENNIIQGLQIMPLTKYPDTDDTYTETIFDFPFDDQWFVFWGGANSLVNYHYEYENQRYAYDFVVMDDNSSFEGDPSLNESYYAYGKDYLAPADGTVVGVENDVKDNEPVGTMNEDQPMGNYVILDHGNEEYSYLAHFKFQSIEVKEGDKVKKGDLLGLVGNSGNSSEPHIHFHVANSMDPIASKSIRITFDQKDEVIQGDTVK